MKHNNLLDYFLNVLEKFSNDVVSKDSNVTVVTNMVATMTPMVVANLYGLPSNLSAFLGVAGSYLINILLEQARNIDREKTSVIANE